jgi:hypothetical protein
MERQGGRVSGGIVGSPIRAYVARRREQFGRCACGCTPAFGRVVGVFEVVVYGTAEAVPLRGCCQSAGGLV